MTEPAPLTVSVADGVATIRIDRPARKNAMSVAVFNGLSQAWRELGDDVRVIVLTSADCGVFSAGLDLKEAAQLKAETGRDILSFLDDPFQRAMRRVSVPIIAAMTGDLFGGGMMLALSCDLRVGLAGTRAGITEAKIGRGSPWGMPLLWMLPEPIVSELVLVGDLVPIERLHQLGFINHVEPTPDAVRARAAALARQIADNAPLSVAAGKRSIRAALDRGCEAALDEAEAIYRPVYASDDAQEGPRAFAEKRRPLWKGR
ncbi:MAG: enoyl-CoA hydratase/isomerase family protein [Kofleriaceae bacterium]